MLIVIDAMAQSEVEVLLVPSRFCKLLMVARFALEIIAGVIDKCLIVVARIVINIFTLSRSHRGGHV